MLFPLSKSHGLAFYGEASGRASIACLLSVCRPYAVFQAVVPVIVQSFNRKPRLPRWPHVIKKRRVITPTVADGYSPTAIAGIPRIFQVCASAYYSNPALVHWVGRLIRTTSMAVDTILLTPKTVSSRLRFRHNPSNFWFLFRVGATATTVRRLDCF